MAKCDRAARQFGSVHLVGDSTGIKVYGGGEWKSRQYGVSKCRTWRKLHVDIGEATGEILAGGVTSNTVYDSEFLLNLLEVTDADLEQVSADGSDDTRPCYEVIQEREAKAGIPPRKTAKSWQHSNCKAPPHPRDENLRAIRQHGRKAGSGSRTITAAYSPLTRRNHDVSPENDLWRQGSLTLI